MQRIFNRRVFRELKKNLPRYLALFLLIVVGMYMIVSIVAAAESVIQGENAGFTRNHVEDGEFTVFVPLEENKKNEIQNMGFTLEEKFYMDYTLENGACFRIFSNRDKINLVEIQEGETVTKENEIVLERQYADARGLNVGDEIQIAGKNYEICGIGTTPDYGAALKNLSDSSVEPLNFGIGFITNKEYQKLKNEKMASQTEEYCYSYLSNGQNDLKLKDYLSKQEIEITKMDDPYLNEMVEDIEQKKRDLQDGIVKLSDGVDELDNGTKDLQEGAGELRDGTRKLADGSYALRDGVREVQNGQQELTDGITDFTGGINRFVTGAVDLNKGAEELREGTYQLLTGVASVRGGTMSLANGAGRLLTGGSNLQEQTQTLADGITAMSPETGEMVSAIASGIGEVNSGISGIKSGAEALDEGISKLQGGIAKVDTGAEALSDGTQKLQDGTNELSESAGKLQDGANELSNGTNELYRGADELAKNTAKVRDGQEELYQGTLNLSDGVDKMRDGVDELQNQTEKMIDEYFTYKISNLTMFLRAKDNARIGAASNDVIINKFAGMVAGVIVMALFTYVISVFVIHQIEQEGQVIGALYAMGVTSKKLMRHYLMLPVLIAFLGGAVGMFVGYSKYGINIQMQESISYFSIPVMSVAHPMYLMIYGFAMPGGVAFIVNRLVINKKLTQTALSLLRNEQKQNKINNVNLGEMKFISRFQLRQFLRELRSGMAVVMGMLICLIILMMGVDCYGLCANMSKQCSEDTTYQYMYSYKYPSKEVPKDGTACYTESFKKEAYGYQVDVVLMGIDKDNPYFSFPVTEGQNKVALSDAAAEKFKLSVGDVLVITDDINERNYAFTVDKIVPYSVGLYAFMDIDSMRELFDQEEDYYNVVLADKELKIDSGRLYSTTSKKDIEKNAEVFLNLMWSMIIMLIGLSTVVFIVVMYLMMKVMIDRSASGIALMKILGYREKEIRKLYLDGNRNLIMIAALICIPISKWIMDLLYPYLTANVACGLNLSLDFKIYLLIYVGIILCYLIINWLLAGRIRHMIPAEILKNRE